MLVGDIVIAARMGRDRIGSTCAAPRRFGWAVA